MTGSSGGSMSILGRLTGAAAAAPHPPRDDLSVSCDEHANLAIDFFGNFGNSRKNRPVDKKVFVVRPDKSVKPRKHGLFYSFRIAVNHNKIR